MFINTPNPKKVWLYILYNVKILYIIYNNYFHPQMAAYKPLRRFCVRSYNQPPVYNQTIFRFWFIKYTSKF